MSRKATLIRGALSVLCGTIAGTIVFAVAAVLLPLLFSGVLTPGASDAHPVLNVASWLLSIILGLTTILAGLAAVPVAAVVAVVSTVIAQDRMEGCPTQEVTA